MLHSMKRRKAASPCARGPVIKPAATPPAGAGGSGGCRALAPAMICALLALPAGAQVEEGAADPMARPSRIMPLATAGMLLDARKRDGLIVAVGEHGIILASTDEGNTWAQAEVPVRSTLTGVYLHDDRLGWAVGHDSLIMRTRDGAATWEILKYAPEEQTPLLDVWFADENRGITIGAYGYYFVTSDGGDSWEQIDFLADEYVAAGDEEALAEEVAAEEEDPGQEGVLEEVLWDMMGGPLDFHLNRLLPGPAGRLYIAAEAGNVFRSDDGGDSWVMMPSPYDGSFFGGQTLGGEALIVFGLRGHVFRSDDGGVSWTELDTGTTASLMSASRVGDEGVLVAGLAGVLLESRDGGRSFELRQQIDRMGHAGVLPAGADEVVLFGDGGVRRRGIADLRSGGQSQADGRE